MSIQTSNFNTNSIAELNIEFQDLCLGADPYVFKQGDLWYLLLQEDLRATPMAHEGIHGYTLRSARSIPELKYSAPKSLIVGSQSDNLKQVWAGEIHFDRYLYVAASQIGGKNHRIFVYETKGDLYGPWYEIGVLEAPREDDSWAIDLTVVEIPVDGVKKHFAVWSGWKETFDEFPQHIYIAQMSSPTKIGKRYLIASPTESWCSSVEPILEGPQSLVLENEFRGIVLTGNASWTTKYSTSILKYIGTNPTDSASWQMASSSLFPDGLGIGHGVILEDNGELYYVGHRKTLKTPGWEDRVVFYTKLNRDNFKEYLSFY